MGAISQVKAQVFRGINGYESWKEGCNPIPQEGVSCDYNSQGARWMVPQVEGGVVTWYEETFEDASNYADAFKAIRLSNKETGDIIYILGEENNWLDNCNACCGATPAMPVITLPDPNLSEAVCCMTTITESNCVYNQYGAIGTLGAGQKIQLAGNNGGVAFTPAPPVDGFASVAEALAWATANWSAYGTFAAVGTEGIKMTSSTVKSGGFSISLLKTNYCLTITAGDKFTVVTHNGVNRTVPEVTVIDAAQVIAAIKQYFGDGVLTAFSATKINYLGTGVPGGYSGTNTRTFTAGACA